MRPMTVEIGKIQAKAVAAPLLCFWLAVGCAAAQAAPQEVEVDIFQGTDSLWTLEHDPEERRVIARLEGEPEVGLEIDYDGSADDQHLIGVTPILGGERLEGAFWGSVAPLIYPQLDPEEHQTELLTVRGGGGALWVRFEGGTYQILEPEGPDEPLFMEAVFRRKGDRLEVLLYGLYYLLPSQAGTRIELTTAGGMMTREVRTSVDGEASLISDGSVVIGTVSDGRHLEYFDKVTRVVIDDTLFGRLELDTFVERLQIQVNRQAGVPIELLELDFDHSFKDRGQRRVMSRLSIELP
jgi:hypothetical protein